MKPVPSLQKPTAGVFRDFKSGLLEHPTIVPGDRVLAACSGGPDSVALVSLLFKLRQEMPVDVVVAHFDHGLRAESGVDEKFVREMARERRLPFVSGSADVRAHAAENRMNLEEAGRVLRYRFLQAEAERIRATKIATGHTMNDQAETFLMRLMRGTGLAGLAGIPPIRAAGPCLVVRPLLGLTRARLLAFLEDQGQAFRTDATNLDRRNLRNRIRLGLLPDLERNYEPRIVEHLARTASLAREEDELLTEFVRELSQTFLLRKSREVSLDARGLPPDLPALSRRVLREFLREVRGDLRSISYEDVASVLGLKDGKERALPGGPTLVREKGWIRVKGKRTAPRPFRLSWNGVERLEVAGAGMEFEGARRKPAERAASRKGDLETAVLDASKLAFPIVVRNRRPGDLYRPLGAPGRKKLKEILRAKGVPREARDRLPVFCSGGDIVWVPGLPVAEKFKVTPKTKTVFVIEKK
ncbi:MAG: tRNA lysidine(34) synthetase TilS [Candidatus Aminicenantes bacterium]